MAKRQSISKRVRFEVFSRDNFTCRYCGRQSDAVRLVIDHAEPVCQGGDNSPENLLTACEDCNLGKGGRTISQHAPTEQDRLRLAQERAEQLSAYEAAKQATQARDKLRQVICNYWCECTGRTSVCRQSLNVVVTFIPDFGLDRVLDWIDIASRARAARNDSDMCRYICGIRRNVIKEGSQGA